MQLLSPGALLRSDSGRPLDPVPKGSKKNKSPGPSDRAVKKWLQKQANDELAYINPTQQPIWFHGVNNLTNESLRDGHVFLFGHEFTTAPWHLIHHNPTEKRANDLATLQEMESILAHMEKKTRQYEMMSDQIKGLLGTMLFEDELTRRWEQKDKSHVKPLRPSIALFETIGPETNKSLPGLDIGFQVWKIEDSHPRKDEKMEYACNCLDDLENEDIEWLEENTKECKSIQDVFNKHQIMVSDLHAQLHYMLSYFARKNPDAS